MDAGFPFSPKAAGLQFILSSGYFSVTNFEKFISAANNQLNLSEEYKLTVDAVKEEAQTVLGVLSMELLDLRDDYKDGERYLVVVNREQFSEPLNRIIMPQSLGVQFKALLKVLFRSSRCNGLDPRDLTNTEFPAKSELLSRLLEDEWLLEIDRRIYPSMRLLYELEGYLNEHYGGKTLFPCLGCDQWLLKGKSCSNSACSARLHDRCYDAFYEAHPDSIRGVCPLCSSSL